MEDYGKRQACIEVRRYAVVALTNLTFGNANIKSFLCSFPSFVSNMVLQLQPRSISSSSENLRKATAHLFRNLAWKADKGSKQILADSDVVGVLMRAAMDVLSRASDIKDVEPTLKVILSALWNLSAHCRKNKVMSHECVQDSFCVKREINKKICFCSSGKGTCIESFSTYMKLKVPFTFY